MRRTRLLMTLPLSLSLPNTNTPTEIGHDATQVLDQRLQFRLDLFATTLS